jgi:hypothetical protein
MQDSAIVKTFLRCIFATFFCCFRATPGLVVVLLHQPPVILLQLFLWHHYNSVTTLNYRGL